MHLKNAEIIFAAKDETEKGLFTRCYVLFCCLLLLSLLMVYFLSYFILAAIKEKRTVDLLKFILYLYIQHAHVISMKSPIVTGDEYPLRSRSSDLEGRAAIGIKVCLHEESKQRIFFNNFLTYGVVDNCSFLLLFTYVCILFCIGY